MSDNINFSEIKNYFQDKLENFGTTPRGADWNSEQSQYLRFDQLMNICDTSGSFSILDYGCGWGSLVNYLQQKGHNFTYFGYDILEPMIINAREVFKDFPNCTFTHLESDLKLVDYSIASGIFNFRNQYSFQGWTDYVVEVISKMDSLSRKGMAFNMLTKYSDTDRMRPDLYYADPCFFFDYCKTHFSKSVALLHDYGLYDFTVLVRKPD